MPKPRSIDAGFFDDPDIANLTRDERLLLIGMISTCADDEGRLMAEPGYLRKKVFGYDDDVTKGDVLQWRDNVVNKCRNVKLYEVAGQCYMWLVNWSEYQNIRYVVASKLPEYTEECDVSPFNKEDCGKLPEISVNSPRVGLSRVNVGLGESTPQNAASAPPPSPKKKRSTDQETSIPDEFEPTLGMVADAKKKYPNMDVLGASEAWKNAMKANKRKYRYTDWNQAWWNGLDKAEEWGQHRIGGSNGTQGRFRADQQGGLGSIEIPKSARPPKTFGRPLERKTS